MTSASRTALAALLLVAGHQISRRAIALEQTRADEPPATLSQTGLYARGVVGAVDPRNRPFVPQYPLWSDGALKRRWVYVPEGQHIEAIDPDGWEFPVGTRFWKEFSFNGRKAETRMLWKTTEDRWTAATYVWNDDGSEATLAPEAGAASSVEVAPDRIHSVPSRSDCGACHGSAHEPLGFNRLQLSTDRDPQAIHAEPLTAGMLTVKALERERLLSPASGDLWRHPPRINATSANTRAALGYLSTNCGTCHDGSAAITAAVPSLNYRDVMKDGDAVARSLVGRPSRWQAPGKPGGTLLIDPGSPAESAILLRMKSRRPSSQMPPLGTVIRDEAALRAITEWIAEVTASR
jgi:hypothetical protein